MTTSADMRQEILRQEMESQRLWAIGASRQAVEVDDMLYEMREREVIARRQEEQEEREAEEDRRLARAEEKALAIWQNGSNDDVWTAVFEEGIDVAAELLERIERTDFAVGDLTHEQCVAAIVRRYPLLGGGR